MQASKICILAKRKPVMAEFQLQATGYVK